MAQREALAMLLRPGNAGSNTAADHVTVIDRSLAQIPDAHLETIAILIRADTAGATHGTADHCQRCDLRFSFDYELTEAVRSAILDTPEDAWIAALDQDGSERPNGQVAELTDRVELSSWPTGSRVIVRRERPHPGAQLSFTDHDGYRFQAILTGQADRDIAVLERRHRQRARVEDRVRDDKDTGLAKLPFRAFTMNEVWVEIVMLAHDLIVWTQALALDGELATAEPKRLRYRLLHIAARLALSARQAKLHLPAARTPLSEQTPGRRPRSPLAQTLQKPRSTRRRALLRKRTTTHNTPTGTRQPTHTPKTASAVTPRRYCTIGARRRRPQDS